MSLQVHELANLRLVQKYFEQLPSDDLSRRYYNGEKYVSNFVNRLRLCVNTESIYEELHRFYPHQPLINATRDAYLEMKWDNQKLALAFSTFATLMLHGMAKKGRVLPFLSKYGRVLKTHRLFRHYVWVWALPSFLAWDLTNYRFLNQTEHLWAVHAQRMNEQLEDPLGTEYPLEILPAGMVGIWQPRRTPRHDLQKKWANETHIGLAPDYEQVQEWEKLNLEEEKEQDEDGQEEEEEE